MAAREAAAREAATAVAAREAVAREAARAVAEGVGVSKAVEVKGKRQRLRRQLSHEGPWA